MLSACVDCGGLPGGRRPIVFLRARQTKQDEAGPGNTIAIRCNNADKVHQTDIQLAHSSRPAAPFMIVCSCNVLSDHKIRDVVTAAG